MKRALSRTSRILSESAFRSGMTRGFSGFSGLFSAETMDYSAGF
jgi:hypothetical protein